MSNEQDAPSAFPWPPVLLAGAIALALAVDRWVAPLPVPFAEVGAVRVVGIGLLLGAAVVFVWTASQFKRHGTTIRPDRASTALVERGPFAWSRNPIYLAETIALLGAAIVFNKLMLVLVTPVFAVLVGRLAIRPEEAFLERRFGLLYVAYTSRVRRWL